MSQALAWMYFDDNLDKIRPLGMRGAVEIKHLIDDLDAPDPSATAETQPHPEAMLTRIATILDLDAETRQIVFRQILGAPAMADETEAADAISKVASDKTRARAALLQIAATLKQDPATLEIAFREIANDPYTEFFESVWDEVRPTEPECYSQSALQCCKSLEPERRSVERDGVGAPRRAPERRDQRVGKRATPLSQRNHCSEDFLFVLHNQLRGLQCPLNCVGNFFSGQVVGAIKYPGRFGNCGSADEARSLLGKLVLD